MVITVRIECADSEHELFQCLNALRRWERARASILMAFSVDAPTLTVEQLRGVYGGLEPPIPFVTVVSASSVN